MEWGVGEVFWYFRFPPSPPRVEEGDVRSVGIMKRIRFKAFSPHVLVFRDSPPFKGFSSHVLPLPEGGGARSASRGALEWCLRAAQAPLEGRWRGARSINTADVHAMEQLLNEFDYSRLFCWTPVSGIVTFVNFLNHAPHATIPVFYLICSSFW